LAADLIPLPRGVLDRLADLGVDVPRSLRRAGLSPSRFQPRRATLTTREFLTFWHAVQSGANTRDVGLRLFSARPDEIGIVSLAAVHSPNLGEALAKIARYMCKDLVVDINDGEVRIGFYWGEFDDIPEVLVEAMFSWVLSLARKGTGKPLNALRVELARRRADEAMLKDHFACDVRFDAPADILVLEESALTQPFVKRHTDLYAAMLPKGETALHERLMPRSLADEVKVVLRRCMTGQYVSVERVAGEMHMSARTLQRRLAKLETSYQRLLDEVRNTTARRLLSSTDLEASEIAFLLGFHEVNSFTRAFQGWEGSTPSRWRQFQQQNLRSERSSAANR
jgi:AraC-like DNA-binding protein